MVRTKYRVLITPYITILVFKSFACNGTVRRDTHISGELVSESFTLHLLRDALVVQGAAEEQ